MVNNYFQPRTSRLKKYSSYSNPPTPETDPTQTVNQGQGMYPSSTMNQGRGMNQSQTMNQGQGMNPWSVSPQSQGTSRPAGMYQIPGRKLPPIQNQGMGTDTFTGNQQSPGTSQSSGKKALSGKRPQDSNALGLKSAAQDNQVAEYRTGLNNFALTFPNSPKEKYEDFSQERLQEAILWSEILGKPVSKRRKRRM